MSREIMQMALATLKNCLPVNYCYNNFGEASPMYKKDGLSVEKINESIKSLEDALAQPELIQVRPAEFIAAASIGVGADFVGTPMMWAEWPTPKSSTVRWSIPVDPNNFGEPVAQPVQEPTECGYDETVGMCTNNPCCEQTPVAHLWECIGRWSAYLASNGEKANLAPPEWLVDAVKAATLQPSKEWVGLTDEEMWECQKLGLSDDVYRATEAKLKEKNNAI